jgi:hypothetical protein
VKRVSFLLQGSSRFIQVTTGRPNEPWKVVGLVALMLCSVWQGRRVTLWFGVNGESCFTLSTNSRFLQNLTKPQRGG